MRIRRRFRLFPPITTGYLASVLSIMLIGDLLIIVLSYLHTRRTIKDMASHQAVQALSFLNRKLNSTIMGMRQDIRQWSRERVSGIALSDSYLGKSVRAAANIRLTERLLNTNLERISLLDKNGDITASSDSDIVEALNVGDREHFMRSLKVEVIVDILPSSYVTAKPILVVSAPVNSPDLDEMGVMPAVLNLNRFAQNLLDEVRFGKTGGA